MPPFPVVLEKTTTKAIDISIAYTQSIFSSMLLLAKGSENEPGIHDWITQTRAKLSKKELDNHALAIIGFFYALTPEEGQVTFPAYLNQLEKTDAVALRNKMLNAYATMWEETTSAVDWSEILASSETYIDFLKSRFEAEYIDEKLEKRAYDYVIDPPAMKDFLVGHLTWIWKTHFEAEWRRVEGMLLDTVKAFKTTDIDNMSRIEAARFITGQELDETKWCEKLDNAEKIIFVPNVHIGPYIHTMASGNILYLLFGARMPEGTGERIPELDRTEIVARLSALADNTRLHILQLVAEQGEVRVQDILEVINLSQPSVSRYLSQLTAAGYLQERRENGAKVYILNKDRIEKTLKAVNAFLLNR